MSKMFRHRITGVLYEVIDNRAHPFHGGSSLPIFWSVFNSRGTILVSDLRLVSEDERWSAETTRRLYQHIGATNTRCTPAHIRG